MIKQGTRVIVEEKTREGRIVTHGHVTRLFLTGPAEELEAVTVTGVSQEFIRIGGSVELEGAEFERVLTVPVSEVEVVS
jgi:hypothetical protein